ncbi:heterokaryon incompatibility protein-domain-containing protein, partial [Cercophora newfieldiana]
MSRWHESSCINPDVVWDSSAEAPRCRVCNARCAINELRFDQPKSPNLVLPPNEPHGQLNLRWPSSVFPSPPAVSPSASRPDPPTREKTGGTAPPSVVYGQQLKPGEFRLASLSAVEGGQVDQPVHLALETYQRDNCPEYETVSYTWGGENGDYTLSHPIFIGPHWDVLFQSRNCWEMMRFIRPRRGVRLVWVDAVCINQSDIDERGEQVSSMGDIYRHCSRVVVYLGPDVVPTPRDGRFPPRHPLHKIDEVLQSPRFDLPKLLARSYFGRSWMIQELVLAPSAIFHVAGVDFWTDTSGICRMRSPSSAKWDWDATPAPWFQHIGQGEFPTRDLYDILRLTSNSRASDPRDRVFGILGLLQRGDEGMKEHPEDYSQLQPDYSLSAQQVFIGVVAHLIINCEAKAILYHAVGTSGPDKSLTWMP